VALATAGALAGCAGDGTTLGPDGRPLGQAPKEDGNMMDDGEQPKTDITLTQLSRELFSLNCSFVGCHGGSLPASNMSLESNRLAQELVNVASVEKPQFKRVDPGNPDDSYLLMKLRGDSRISGQQMPLGSPPLDSALLEKVRSWIAGGAPVE
jgi:hypothetical protein